MFYPKAFHSSHSRQLHIAAAGSLTLALHLFLLAVSAGKYWLLGSAFALNVEIPKPCFASNLWSCPSTPQETLGDNKQTVCGD